MNRRQFIKRTFWSLAGLGLSGGLYTWQIEPFWLEFVRVNMPIKNLPDSLIGKTLMQISDIHIGKRFDYRYIIDSFEKAKDFSPDFVVYTGDYVSTYKDEVQYQELAEVLKSLVRGKLGTIGILGNHDYGRNWSQSDVADKISSMLLAQGVSLLRNESIHLHGLNFTGFDDYWDLISTRKKHCVVLTNQKPILCCATTRMFATSMCGATTTAGYCRGTRTADK